MTDTKEPKLSYYERNREKIVERSRQRYKEKGAEIREATKRRREENPERDYEIARNSRLKNKERVAAECTRWRDANRDKHRESNKNLYYGSLQRRLFDNAKNRAKRKGVPFTLVMEDIIVPDVCPMLGVPFVWGNGLNDYSPSLDRLIPENGYVPGNVTVITTLANRIKSNASLDQIKKVYDYLLNLEAS